MNGNIGYLEGIDFHEIFRSPVVKILFIFMLC
jgi:hypothetical protein